MMTVEGFQNYLEREAKKKIPFIAYWHPQGFGLLFTEVVIQQRRVYELYYADSKRSVRYWDPRSLQDAVHQARRSGRKIERITEGTVNCEPVSAKKSTIRKFRKELDRMRKQFPTLCTAEFDGEEFVATEGLEL